ncbi:MAG: GIY-YIG nuclease family protein [bacterium]|nr:GIY-YIG nuclease family protein [bacterium]
MYTIYAIISKSSKKIYIGQTIDIDTRLKQHNDGGNDHLGKYTAQNKGPWKLIYTEPCNTRSEALKREKQLKSFRGREFIKKLIKDK